MAVWFKTGGRNLKECGMDSMMDSILYQLLGGLPDGARLLHQYVGMLTPPHPRPKNPPALGPGAGSKQRVHADGHRPAASGGVQCPSGHFRLARSFGAEVSSSVAGGAKRASKQLGQLVMPAAGWAGSPRKGKGRKGSRIWRKAARELGNIHIYIYIDTYIYIFTCMHVYIYVCMYTHVHAYIHIKYIYVCM